MVGCVSDIQRTIDIKSQRNGLSQNSSAPTRSSDGRNDSVRRNQSHPVVVRIRNPESPLRADGNPHGRIKFRRDSRPTISRKALTSIPSNRRPRPSCRKPTNHMATCIGDIEIACGIVSHTSRLQNIRSRNWSEGRTRCDHQVRRLRPCTPPCQSAQRGNQHLCKTACKAHRQRPEINLKLSLNASHPRHRDGSVTSSP